MLGGSAPAGASFAQDRDSLSSGRTVKPSGEGFTGQLAESDGGVAKNRRLGILRFYPADPPEVASASAPQTLPSTRAGGQDDVSSNKLPQMI